MFHSPVGQHILLLAYMVKIKTDYNKLLGFNYNISVSYKCNCDCREGRWSGRDEEPHWIQCSKPLETSPAGKSILTHPLKLLRACILPFPPAHVTKEKKLEPEIPDDSPELPAPAQRLEDQG